MSYATLPDVNEKNTLAIANVGVSEQEEEEED
jgi:hypothetical protein